MGNVEENLDLLNFDQEDDNLLLATSPVPEVFLGVTPPSPAPISDSNRKKASPLGELENCNGDGEQGEPGTMVALQIDLNVKVEPTVSNSPNVPSSVLSVLDLNAINKLNITRDMGEATWSRKAPGTKGSVQLDGIAETSPVKNPSSIATQLSRTYLDIEREQAGMTPEKGDGEPTVHRRSRTRRSTTLRKSLAWDKAFFTDEGVLDNEELFAVVSDTPRELPMPELSSLWNVPENLVISSDVMSTCATSSALNPELSTLLNVQENHVTPREVVSTIATASACRPELVTVSDGPEEIVIPAEAAPSIPTANARRVQKQSVLTTTHANTPKPSQDVAPPSSGRSVRQIKTTGSHAFSNAYSRAAALPQGSTSIPLPTGSSSRAVRQPAGGHRLSAEDVQGCSSDARSTFHTKQQQQQQQQQSAAGSGLHHQARIAAMKKAHEAPGQKGPRVWNPIKKVDKHVEEVPKGKQPVMLRCNSTPNLQGSPSSLSRRMSIMSKKVKDTLGKVMTGRMQKPVSTPSSPHVPSPKKPSMFSKKPLALPAVSEVKDPSTRARSTHAAAPIVEKQAPKGPVFTVRDMLQGKGPSLIRRDSVGQGPTLTRSKSAFSAPGLPRVAGAGPVRVIQPVAPLTTEPPAVAAQPTGLRKPSPKLGFFDSSRTPSMPQKSSTITQPFQGSLPARPESEATLPGGAHGKHLQAQPSSDANASHLLYGVASAPTSPRAHVLHPSSLQGHSSRTTRASSPTRAVAAVADSHTNHNTESHKLVGKRLQFGGQKPKASKPFKPCAPSKPWDSEWAKSSEPSEDSADIRDSEWKRGVEPDGCLDTRNVPRENGIDHPSVPSVCVGVENGLGQSGLPLQPRGGTRMKEDIISLSHTSSRSTSLVDSGCGTSSDFIKDFGVLSVSAECADSLEIDRLTSGTKIVSEALVSSSPRNSVSVHTEDLYNSEATCLSLQSSAVVPSVINSTSSTYRTTEETAEICGTQPLPERANCSSSLNLVGNLDPQSGVADPCQQNSGCGTNGSMDGVSLSSCGEDLDFEKSMPIGKDCGQAELMSLPEAGQSARVQEQYFSSSKNGCEGFKITSPSMSTTHLRKTDSEQIFTPRHAAAVPVTSADVARFSEANESMSSVGAGVSPASRSKLATWKEVSQVIDSKPAWDCTQVIDSKPAWDCSQVIDSKPAWDCSQVIDSNPAWDKSHTACELPEHLIKVGGESTPRTQLSSPASKECFQTNGLTNKIYASPRSRSFRETSTRLGTPRSDYSSPVAQSKFSRNNSSHRPAWHSGSPGEVSPASGKNARLVSPSHAPDAAGSFETLTSSRSNSFRTPDGSAKRVVRKIVEFESPSSQWSDWPVLGAAISEDQVPGSGKKEEEALSKPNLPRHSSTDHAIIEPSSEAQLASSAAAGMSTPPSKPAALAEADAHDRNPLAGLNVDCTPGSNKKEKGSSLFSFAKKAVGRLKSSPVSADLLSGQENEESPRSQKTSRRLSRSSSHNTSCSPAIEPRVLSPCSEAKIRSLETTGQIRTNGHQPGPFDYTNLKYINSGIST